MANGTIECNHSHNHAPMLPIEGEYVLAVAELKSQVSADPIMDINDVKRSYQRLRDLFGNCCFVFCWFGNRSLFVLYSFR